MEKFSRRKRYNSISLVTFLVIAITFGYYYFYYVQFRESQFNAKAFRTIENIGNNVSKKHANYYGNVRNALLHISKYEGGFKNVDLDLLKAYFKKFHVPQEIEAWEIKKGCKDYRLNKRIKKLITDVKSGDEILMVLDTVVKDTTVFCKFPTEALLANTLNRDFFKKFVVISQKTFNEGSDSTRYPLDIVMSDIPLVINKRANNKKLDTTLFSKGSLSNTRLIHINYENNEHKLYITPVNMGDGTTLFIGGIIEKEVFRRNTFGLGPVSFSAIIMFLILLVLLLPFLKLFLLSEDERLNTVDAVFSFISLVVGAAVVFILMINWQSRNIIAVDSNKKLLTGFTKTIDSLFIDEIRESLSILNDFDIQNKGIDDFLKSNPNRDSEYFIAIMDSSSYKNKQKKVVDIDSMIVIKNEHFVDTIVIRNFINTKKDIENGKIKGFLYDKNLSGTGLPKDFSINWMNKNGYQLIKWSERSITPRVNLRSRSYFNKIISKNYWQDSSISNYQFYMQAISSMTDGKNYMIFSKESEYKKIIDTSLFPKRFKEELLHNVTKKGDDLFVPKVVMLATNLSSLKKLPIPSNISYMLVDQKGEVLYHQTEEKTLQENLMGETGYNSKLNSALQTQGQTYFTSTYDGIKRDFYVQPISKLPIFLVTYMDVDHERIINVQIMSLAALLYLLFIIILVVQIGVFVLINFERKTRLKGRNLLFCWFWPDKRKQKVYNSLSVYLTLSMIIYFSFSLSSNIFVSLSYFSLLATFVIFVLKWHHENCDKKNKIRSFVYIILIVGFNILILVISFINGTHLCLLPGLISFFILSGLFFIKIKKQFIYGETFSKQLAIRSYGIFVLLLVLALGFMPVVGFYSKSYNLEKGLYMRSIQLDLAKNIAAVPMDNYKKRFDLARNINSGIVTVSNSSFEATETESICKVGPNKNIKLLTEPEIDFIGKLRFTHDEKMYNNVSLDFLKRDSVWNYKWLMQNEDLVLCDLRHKTYLKSKPERFSVFNTDIKGFLFLITGFLIFCAIFYWFILYWAEKIFLVGLPHEKEKNEFESLLKSFKFIYLISLPHSSGRRYLQKNVKKAHVISICECDNKDFLKKQLDQIRANLPENIVLYDSGSYTEQLLKAKTNLVIGLMNLINDKNTSVEKMILVSNTLPSLKKEKILSGNGNGNTVLNEYLDVLGNFKRVFYPYGFEPEVKEKQEVEHLFNECDIEDKASWDNWKKVFAPTIISDEVEEADIMNIQSVSQIQYSSIWNSLEEREQFVIFDLAEDGLVNYRNIGAINGLISKGILKYENLRLTLFNKSFRNFVLTNIDKKESLRIEFESKRSGNWSNLQLPIIMVIFTLFAFLFVTQQDIFNDIFAWMGTALISLPLLLRVVGSLSFGKTGIGKP